MRANSSPHVVNTAKAILWFCWTLSVWWGSSRKCCISNNLTAGELPVRGQGKLRLMTSNSKQQHFSFYFSVFVVSCESLLQVNLEFQTSTLASATNTKKYYTEKQLPNVRNSMKNGWNDEWRFSINNIMSFLFKRVGWLDEYIMYWLSPSQVVFWGPFLSFYFANVMVCLLRANESCCLATDRHSEWKCRTRRAVHERGRSCQVKKNEPGYFNEASDCPRSAVAGWLENSNISLKLTIDVTLLDSEHQAKHFYHK